MKITTVIRLIEATNQITCTPTTSHTPFLSCQHTPEAEKKLLVCAVDGELDEYQITIVNNAPVDVPVVLSSANEFVESDVTGELQPFTVVILDERSPKQRSDGNTICHIHIQATSGRHAFWVACNQRKPKTGVVVCALKGHLKQGTSIHFPGPLTVDERVFLSRVKMYDGIAAALKTVHFIDDCHVFDLGQFRDLSLMISFTDPVFDSTNKGVLTRRVNTLIEQFIGNAGARISANFSPTPLTEWCSTEKKMVHAGYETRSWLVTLDVFHQDRVISDFEPALKRINTLWPAPAR